MLSQRRRVSELTVARSAVIHFQGSQDGSGQDWPFRIDGTEEGLALYAGWWIGWKLRHVLLWMAGYWLTENQPIQSMNTEYRWCGTFSRPLNGDWCVNEAAWCVSVALSTARISCWIAVSPLEIRRSRPCNAQSLRRLIQEMFS